MFRSIRMLWKWFALSSSAWRTSNSTQLGFRREQSKARRPRPTVKLSFEEMEERTLPSVSPLALQWAQLTMEAQQQFVSACNTIAQEVRYLQQELDLLHGNTANTSQQSLGTAAPQTGSGSDTGSVIPTTPPAAASHPPNTNKIKELTSNGPNIGGPAGFLWDPTNGTNASNPANWDYNMQKQNPLTGLVPGNTPDPVTFDPKSTQSLSNHGGSAITWDYSPAQAFTMYLGGQSAYYGTQTINSGITVDATVDANVTASDFALNFTDGTSKFQIDGNSTITNMYLGGSTAGQLLINSGTTTIAQSNYTELDGASLVVGVGATLLDASQCPLKFWANSVNITVKGTMHTVAKGITLIDKNGNSNDYINVKGGTLSYSGRVGVTDTFNVPVYVQGGGTFVVIAGQLIVQGNVNGTVPGVSNNASVYMTGLSSKVQLYQGATLECDGDYYQDSGFLETMDKSSCTLQDGPNGQLGTATIAGGYLEIANTGNVGDFGIFTITCGQLNFNGTYEPAIAGNSSNGGAGVDNDELFLNPGTLNLQGGSALNVLVNNPPPQGQNLTWTIIQASSFLNNQFNTWGSTPNTPGLTYGPAVGKVYQIVAP